MASAKGRWVGAVTHERAEVSVALDGGAGEIEVRAVAERTGAPGVTVATSPPVLATENNDWWVKLSLSGLSPGTPYAVRFTIDGTVDPENAASFKTAPLPGTPHSFRFGVGSCNYFGATTSYLRALGKGVELFQQIGDLHYTSVNSTRMEPFRDAYRAVIMEPTQHEAFAHMPTDYVWDDHEHEMTGDAARRSVRRAYDEYIPHHPYGEGCDDREVYHSFVWGRVRFIVCDLRGTETHRSALDDANKRKMSAAQEAWFEAELIAAREFGQVACVTFTMPWIHAVSAMSDTWGGFHTQRVRLANMIKRLGVAGRMFAVSGDMHRLALDDGTNSDYADGGGAAFPVFHCGPIHNSSSLKGGPYSHGTYGPEGAPIQQYVIVEIEDQGGDHIGVTYRGYRTDDSIWLEWSTHLFAGAPMIEYQAEYSAADGPWTPVAPWGPRFSELDTAGLTGPVQIRGRARNAATLEEAVGDPIIVAMAQVAAGSAHLSLVLGTGAAGAKAGAGAAHTSAGVRTSAAGRVVRSGAGEARLSLRVGTSAAGAKHGAGAAVMAIRIRSVVTGEPVRSGAGSARTTVRVQGAAQGRKSAAGRAGITLILRSHATGRVTPDTEAPPLRTVCISAPIQSRINVGSMIAVPNIRVRDVGTRFDFSFCDEVGAPLDLSDATDLRARFMRPDGTTLDVPLVRSEAPGVASYTTPEGFFTMAGHAWRVQGIISTAAGTWHCGPMTFAVLRNLPAPVGAP